MFCPAAITLLCLFAIGAVDAQAADDTQIRQLRLQVRQSMQAARDARQAAATAETDSRSAKAQNAELSQALDDVERKRGELSASVSRLQAARAALTSRVAELEKALADEQAVHQKTQLQLGEQAKAREAAERRFAQAQRTAVTCRTHNRELVGVANDLLHAYEEKGVFAVIGEHEPLTGIGQVRLENLLATYGDKIEAAKEGASASD